jgi:hypothetical protein
MIELFCEYRVLPAWASVTPALLPFPAQVSSPCARRACARDGVSCRREVPFLDAYAVVLTVISSPSTPPPKPQREGQGQQAATERQGRADSLAFASRPLGDMGTLFLHQLSASYQGLWGAVLIESGDDCAACEEILLSLGRCAEAYEHYAVASNRSTSLRALGPSGSGKCNKFSSNRNRHLRRKECHNDIISEHNSACLG